MLTGSQSFVNDFSSHLLQLQSYEQNWNIRSILFTSLTLATFFLKTYWFLLTLSYNITSMMYMKRHQS